jgi:hypothetical protein
LNSIGSPKQIPTVSISPLTPDAELLDVDYDVPVDNVASEQHLTTYISDPATAPPLLTVRSKSTEYDYDTPKTSLLSDVSHSMPVIDSGDMSSIGYGLNNVSVSSALDASEVNQSPSAATDEQVNSSRSGLLQHKNVGQQQQPAAVTLNLLDASQTVSNNAAQLETMSQASDDSSLSPTGLIEQFKRIRLEILTTMSQLLKCVSQMSPLSSNSVKVALQQINHICKLLTTSLLALDNFGQFLLVRIPQNNTSFHAALTPQLKSLQSVLGGIDEYLDDISSLSEVSLSNDSNSTLARITLVTKVIPVLLR